jgi:hypothetical protein
MSINIIVPTAVNVLVMLPLLVMVVLMFVRMRALKRGQDDLVQNLGPGVGNWHRINIARPAHFARRLKMIAIEGKGVLILTREHVRIVATVGDGERIDLRVARDRLRLRWLGNVGIASGNLHWISVSGNGRELMLCADTGFNALQSREATADLCRRIDPAFRLAEAASPGPPAIYVPTHAAYWRQFRIGDTYLFDVIQGPLGVWQMDPRKAEDAARHYDETHPDAGR